MHIVHLKVLIPQIPTLKNLHEILRFGLVSLFNGISTVVGYLMPKPFSWKNSSGTI